MKKNTLYQIFGFTALLLSYACSPEEDAYSTSVVRRFEIFMDNEPWSLNVGIATKPLFVYKADGNYVANYSSHYRFALENGSYRILATDTPDQLISNTVNLNDLVINQFARADQKVKISAAMVYNSPFEEILKLNMLSRTGTLRLRSTDIKSDRSYSIVRAIVTPKRSGYKVIDETFVESEITLIKAKTNATGGVNYTDDFIVFQTKDQNNGVNVRFELLDKDSVIVHSRALSGSFEVFPDSITLVEFNLNNADEPIIQDYTVTILSEEWNEEELNPESPFNVPAGYTYVSPTEDIRTIYNQMLNDTNAEEIKLYLKAGEYYVIGRIDISKPLSILGQSPRPGESKATLSMGRVQRMEGSINYIQYENLDIIPTDAYLFDFNLSVPFVIEEISFKNCNIDNLSRSIWRQETPVANFIDGVGPYHGIQFVNNFVVDNCRFLNFADGDRNYSLIGMGRTNPVRNITIANTTIHVLKPGLRGSFIAGTNDQTVELSINVRNSTFVRLGNSNMTVFDIRADNAPKITVSVKDNLFSGISEVGLGTWLLLGNNAEREISNNYRTSDFTLSNWGVPAEEEPISTVTKDELFIDYNSGNLGIKDQSSEVYINRIGDPRWLD